MANTENLAKVIKAIGSQKIRGQKYKFNMGEYVHIDWDDIPNADWCETACCIGGTAWALMNPKMTPRETRDSFLDDIHSLDKIRNWLGLTSRESEDLFMAYGYNKTDFPAITPKEAINTLNHLNDTGKVNWSQANA